MSQTKNNQPAGTHDGEAMAKRKAQHLDICLQSRPEEIEGGRTGLEGVRLIHHSLPELDEREIDTSCELFGKTMRLPLFISSMTGGSKDAFKVNQDLARLAQQLGVGVGMGSIRILFRKPEVLEHFRLKALAPDVPVWANLGAVQVRDMVHKQIFEMIKRLEVDAIAIHLNPAQELFQPDGDQDFSGIQNAIRRFCEACPVPVMVKETGAGIHPAEAVRLLKAGARYVNLAGSGGTSWIKVEQKRYGKSAEERELDLVAREFADWGNPTGLVLATLRRLEDSGRIPGGAIPPPLFTLMEEAGKQMRSRKSATLPAKPPVPVRETSEGILGGKVLASGGIRTGMDLARCLVLGAHAAGAALPVIRELDKGGIEAAAAWFRRQELVLRKVMVLTNCANLGELRRSAYLLSPDLEAEVDNFSRLFH